MFPGGRNCKIDKHTDTSHIWLPQIEIRKIGDNYRVHCSHFKIFLPVISFGNLEWPLKEKQKCYTCHDDNMDVPHAPCYVVFLQETKSKFRTNTTTTQYASHVVSYAISLPAFLFAHSLVACLKLEFYITVSTLFLPIIHFFFSFHAEYVILHLLLSFFCNLLTACGVFWTKTNILHSHL